MCNIIQNIVTQSHTPNLLKGLDARFVTIVICERIIGSRSVFYRIYRWQSDANKKYVVSDRSVSSRSMDGPSGQFGFTIVNVPDSQVVTQRMSSFSLPLKNNKLRDLIQGLKIRARYIVLLRVLLLKW